MLLLLLLLFSVAAVFLLFCGSFDQGITSSSQLYVRAEARDVCMTNIKVSLHKS
jgi:hypothetical protein